MTARSAGAVTAEEVLDFWVEAGPKAWFKSDPALDATIDARFGATCAAAADGTLDHWAATPEGALSLIIVLDQFRRNIHRNSPEAFAADPHARALAEAAIANGFDRQVPDQLRFFFYMPLEHAEDLAAQRRCVELVAALGNENLLKYAKTHHDVVARFGRFPHRNQVLGRRSTPEEQRFLADGGFAPA